MDPKDTSPTDEAQLTDGQLEDVSGGTRTLGSTIIVFSGG